MTKITLTNTILLKFVLTFLLCNTLMLTAWMLVDEPVYLVETVKSETTPALNVYTPHCTVSNPFVYAFIAAAFMLLCWGIKLAWSIRRLPAQYNEVSEYILFHWVISYGVCSLT